MHKNLTLAGALLMAPFLALAGCGFDQTTPAESFMLALNNHCGKAYAGRLVSTDAIDADFAQEPMVMEVRDCKEKQVRIPFHVGDDHSRTWVISRKGENLRLKHDHRHEDGSKDAITQYGGDTVSMPSATRAEFPVDAYSIEMFKREGLTASVTNVWAVQIDDEMFAYELKRENRYFRVEFDLTNPVDAPPPPWGEK